MVPLLPVAGAGNQVGADTLFHGVLTPLIVDVIVKLTISPSTGIFKADAGVDLNTVSGAIHTLIPL